jgi:ABC-type thiamine transport system ATPase subunit
MACSSPRRARSTWTAARSSRRTWPRLRTLSAPAAQGELFAMTIHDNIAYGRPDASAAEVQDAAERAHADEVAARRPDGYDTPVGESGGQLSGGERQRIGLARALLVGRPILLLDHVTSALDPPAANEVLERLAQGTAGTTRVMATYRPSALTLADRIVVLDAGACSRSAPTRSWSRPARPTARWWSCGTSSDRAPRAAVRRAHPALPPPGPVAAPAPPHGSRRHRVHRREPGAALRRRSGLRRRHRQGRHRGARRGAGRARGGSGALFANGDGADLRPGLDRAAGAGRATSSRASPTTSSSSRTSSPVPS